jgi:hypothetical protein
MSAPLPYGTLVRLARELTDDERGWVTLPHGGDRITVKDFFLAGNPDDDEIPVDFYEAHDEHGCTVVIPADAVKVVQTAAEVAARRPPTREQIRDGLASEIIGFLGYDGAEIDETHLVGEHEIEAYGSTRDGLGFGFTVRVTAAWETDQ